MLQTLDFHPIETKMIGLKNGGAAYYNVRIASDLFFLCFVDTVFLLFNGT